MRIKAVGAAFVLVGALALPAGPSDAQTNQTKRQTVVYNRDRTIQISRDEDGRTRTRIIIQRRSFLDPGAEEVAGDKRTKHWLHRKSKPARRKRDRQYVAGLLNTQSALPGPWTLPSRNNPWLGYWKQKRGRGPRFFLLELDSSIA